jgi:hypothetical protein
MEQRRRVCLLVLPLLVLLISAFSGCEGRVAPELARPSANGHERRCVVPVALPQHMMVVTGHDPV